MYKRILTGEPVQQSIFAPAAPAPVEAREEPVKEVHNAAKKGTMADPRPDLEEDTGYWSQVFVLAMAADVKAKRDKTLFGALHGMRCGGTQLVKSEKTGNLVFRPMVGRDGWPSEAEYRQAAARYLKPYDRDMKEILRQLNRGDVSPSTKEASPW